MRLWGACGRGGRARTALLLGIASGGIAFHPTMLVGHRVGDFRPWATAVTQRGGLTRGLAQGPAGLFRGHLATFDQRRVLGQAPVRLHVAVAIGIEDPQLDRVDAHLVRDLVYVAFDGKVDAGDPEAAHRRGRCAVGEDAVDVGIDVGDRVGPGQVPYSLDDGVARKPGVGAAVEVADELPGDDAPVVHHPVLDVPAL